jgi:diguanylate cyclase (GGDEF)-like protein/PAS domain S-box-containing protein
MLLTVAVASAASFTAFGILERVQTTTHKIHQFLWRVFGTMSMGFGIWSMHFIGLLTLQLPLPVYFNVKFSILSVIPALLVSSIILWLVSHQALSRVKLLLGGLLLAGSMQALHYLGLLMMEINADIAYLKPLFFLSLITSVALSLAALKIKNEAFTNQSKYYFINNTQLLSALIMGLALSSVYFVIMQTVVFIPFGDANRVITGGYRSALLWVMCITVLIVLSITLIVPYLFRFRQKVQKNEQDLHMANAAFKTHEAIMVVDKDFKITRINDAFTRMMGYTDEEVIGRSSTLLTIGNDEEKIFSNAVKKAIETEGTWNGEVESQRKDGVRFSDWQTISAIKNKDNQTTHYIYFFAETKEVKLVDTDIEKLAFYDPLTELPNRRLLHERLSHELNIARRYLRAGVLMFLDLDKFRDINNSLGHAVGDLVLIETAKRLRSLLRDTDTAVRLGGDEFVILSSAQDGIDSNLTDHSKAVVEKIIQAILEPYFIDGHELYLSASIGITLYTGIDETVDSLLKRADAAMYQAKAAGRNTYRFYQQSMQDIVDTKLNIERNLGMAISQGELSLHYQPQHADAKTVVAVEALLRWDSYNLGHIPPAKFIPVAEESGLILTIGQWVIEKACEQIISWDQQKIKVPLVAINISAKQFHQANFASNLIYIVLGYNINPNRIMLEVTENIFLGKFEDIKDKMHVLKKEGFKFSIDDFGSGQSSLTYLKGLPFDQLKVDQSFIRGFLNQPTDVAIVKAIASVAKSLKLDLIAEGVETEEHLAFLSDFGCDGYQGNYFSQPLAIEQLDRYIRSFITIKG